MCAPNNKYIEKFTIVDQLSEIYEKKYGNRNRSENAVTEFLNFCENRTELFIATSEDYYHFYHRSFFDYFYTLSILNETTILENIFKEIRNFDFDSEIFELVLARNKQMNEILYQNLIEYCLNNLKEFFKQGNINEVIFYFNVFCNWDQIIDDVKYQDEFVDILCENFEEICKLESRCYNTSNIVNLIMKNDKYIDKINNAYSGKSLSILQELYSVYISNLIPILQRLGSDYSKDILPFMTCSLPFYATIYGKSKGELELVKEIKNVLNSKKKKDNCFN